MVLGQTFREEWGRVLATLVGLLGDFDLAEEAAQEAFAIAAERWPLDGYPTNRRAWLVTTARNRAIDRLRRDRSLATLGRLGVVVLVVGRVRRREQADIPPTACARVLAKLLDRDLGGDGQVD